MKAATWWESRYFTLETEGEVTETKRKTAVKYQIQWVLSNWTGKKKKNVLEKAQGRARCEKERNPGGEARWNLTCSVLRKWVWFRTYTFHVGLFLSQRSCGEKAKVWPSPGPFPGGATLSLREDAPWYNPPWKPLPRGWHWGCRWKDKIQEAWEKRLCLKQESAHPHVRPRLAPSRKSGPPAPRCWVGVGFRRSCWISPVGSEAK